MVKSFYCVAALQKPLESLLDSTFNWLLMQAARRVGRARGYLLSVNRAWPGPPPLSHRPKLP
jgi:hypothetical protein